MIHLANIMIVTDDVSLGSSLQSKLQRHRYLARIVKAQAEAVTLAATSGPDILLLGEQIEAGDPFTLADRLRDQPETADISVYLILHAASADLQSRALACGMADVLVLPVSETKLMARLKPLVRLASMRVELQMRLQAALQLGVTVPPMPAEPQGRDRILLIGTDSERLERHLPQAQLSRVADPYQAEIALEAENFEAVIALVDSDPASFFDLCLQTRNNPRLFNLPLLLIANPAAIDEETAFRHAVTGYFQDPADPRQLGTLIRFLIDRHRQRWALSSALGRAALPALKDIATGAFSRAFLDAYLDARVAYATAKGRPLAIAFFRVPQVENIRQRFGDAPADHLRLQVAQWITRLLRVEDLTARYEENEFCVLLPGTPASEAGVTINRIAGVIAYTDFAVRDVYEAVKVWVQVGSGELREGDSAASLVERARQAIIG